MSSAEPVKTASVIFEGVCPILRVNNAAESLRYYVQMLGFKIDWQYPEGQSPYFASVSRGKCHIFLSEGDQGNPAPGSGSASGMPMPYGQSTAAPAPSFAILPPTIPGPARCRLRISMATCCAWALIRRATNPSASGLTWTACAGFHNPKAAGNARNDRVS